MHKEKIINLLSMAQRAGKISSGDFMVEKFIKKDLVKLLLIADDIAINNKKKYIKLCEDYQIINFSPFSKEELGRIIGKERRVVVAIIDEGFAEALIKILVEK